MNMKLLAEKLTDVISNELSNPMEKQEIKELEKLITDMKKAGLIQKPIYNLPLVDTIGKTYYSSINKH
jgi:hypothetical protein